MSFAPPKSHEFLTISVYESPENYPGKFVAIAKYLSYKTHEWKTDPEPLVSCSYHHLHSELKHMGMIRVNRQEDDDPSILENWV
jgi:hypothetical protein